MEEKEGRGALCVTGLKHVPITGYNICCYLQFAVARRQIEPEQKPAALLLLLSCDGHCLDMNGICEAAGSAEVG